MKIGIIGRKWFGSAVVERLSAFGDIAYVAAPNRDDRTARTARATGIRCVCTDGGGLHRAAPAEAIDLLVSAGSFLKVPKSVRNRAAWSIGYHPSLLPLHRGRTAVEDTIRSGGGVAGGTVYCLEDEIDAGAIVLRDWCFVRSGDDARTLWRRELAPMGLELLSKAAGHLSAFGFLPAERQETGVVGAA